MNINDPNDAPTGNGTIKASVPFVSTVSQTDGKGGMKNVGSEINIVSFKVGLGIGIDVSLNWQTNNGGGGISAVLVPNPSEGTNYTIFVPSLKK